MPENDSEPAKKHDLSLPDRIFIDSYTDLDSPTFSNATQSYMHAHPKAGYNTAAVNGSRKLNDTSIRAYIEAKLSQLGAGSDVRLAKLQEVILGSHTKKVVTRQTSTDDDGNEVEHVTEVQSSPSASERIKAIDLVNRMIGLYDNNRESASAARQEYMKMKRGKGKG